MSSDKNWDEIILNYGIVNNYHFNIWLNDKTHDNKNTEDGYVNKYFNSISEYGDYNLPFYIIF